VLDIGLDLGIIVFTANETLRVEDPGKEFDEFAYSGKNRARHLRVLGIHGDLVLCGVADQTLVIGEGDI